MAVRSIAAPPTPWSKKLSRAENRFYSLRSLLF